MNKNKIAFAAADSRVVVSRIFGVLVIILALFTGHSFTQDSMTDILFEISGLFFLTICSIGRLWALMYIGGLKRRELITNGPYSIVRNPLYVSSLIGAIGIGLASENLLILAVILFFYLLYYPFTVLAEEKKLADKFGNDYIEYAGCTPRFWPKLSLYKKAKPYQINTSVFLRSLATGMWFIWIFILLHFIEMLQNAGFIPVVLRIP
jgi:protein-S-isoprenylcysteine O-methyltransferase Ste14